MLSVAVFLCLLVILVSGLKELIVNPGQDAPLQCQGPRDAEITLLEWNRADLKSDDYVFLYRNQRPYENYQHESFKGRVNLMDPSMKDGNVSVTLRNVKLTDTGTYKGQITTKETESVVHECSISLKVTTSDKHTKESQAESKDGGERDTCLSVIIPVLLSGVGYGSPSLSREG
ncbi:V-set domain-containing T-cell activation inhibitor 1-like [Simochromis diagramma]|uniref:V-set domain-containing T-cell activation inhibitor 1-like n=1 Tax=Simochromis diagramma TaxID=43689 RepID=UPI001A7F0F6A|nr:V-set domain-containing T-cell activation inhibitor 1-like [Simochromis diagramma]